jgi:uncharacterized protein (TIGR02646 family)
MRFIRGNNPPEALIRCLALRRESGQALDYEEVSNIEVDGAMVSVKAEIRKARIADQGGICAYTMMRINEDTCHNEHLIPQVVSRENEKIEQTLDYRNIVACYPKREGRGGCGFGAAARGKKLLAITPLDPSCEQRIRFDRGTGRAVATNLDDTAISEVLDDVLVLNHDTLVARRLEALEMAGVSVKCRNPISESQARSLAHAILEHRRGKLLAPFCVAVAQAAIRHADLIEKRRRQKRGCN